ncbi:hypothetical protein GCM10023194_25100 [Planotetraspora phitsanulokensis]
MAASVTRSASGRTFSRRSTERGAGPTSRRTIAGSQPWGEHEGVSGTHVLEQGIGAHRGILPGPIVVEGDQDATVAEICGRTQNFDLVQSQRGAAQSESGQTPLASEGHRHCVEGAFGDDGRGVRGDRVQAEQGLAFGVDGRVRAVQILGIAVAAPPDEGDRRAVRVLDGGNPLKAWRRFYAAMAS